ncbi:hypothetical protein [Streptomyces sp. NPDC058989]|uniref:hypothetical protein n=1 Tax=Streptomyces sp. NPDC058989 TaxID=3346686 RepID=UPI0036A4749E
MHHVIRLFEPLLRLLLPGAGRHRDADVPPPCARCAEGPTSARPPFLPPVRHSEAQREEEYALVLPYLIAYERRQRRREYWRRQGQVVG